MKRSNSRNQQISQISGKGGKSPVDQNYNIQNQRFNQTSNPLQKQMISNNTGTLSRQKVAQNTGVYNHNSDLHKSSTQQREEIHELMHQIEMPDDSLTVSSLSQSPWHTRSRQNFSQTHGTNENSNSNDNDGTMIDHGRSEILEGTVDANSRTLSITRRQNQTASYLDADDSQNQISQDYDDSQLVDQDQSEQQISGYINRNGNNYRRRQNLRANNDYSDQDQSKDEVDDDNCYSDDQLNKKEYSPDFNRHSGAATGNEDDLTVSNNTVISNTNRTYRSGNSLQNRAPQNRTFADSVINHANKQLNSESNNNTHRNTNYVNSSSNQETQRNLNKNYIKEQESEQDEDDDELDRSEDDDSNYNSQASPHLISMRRRKMQDQNQYDQNLDSSEFSQVESFTQTQYSKISKLGKSKMFARIKGDSLDLTEDVEADGTISMHRSPNLQKFKNLEHEESLSLTPVSNNNWMMRATNRTTVDKSMQQRNTTNTLNQVARDLNRNNATNDDISITINRQQPNYNATQVLFGGKHNKSRGTDPELVEALEEESSKQNTIEVESSEEKIRPKRNKMAEELEQKDQFIMQIREFASNIEQELNDTKEHLELLKQKTRDDSKLKALRGSQLELAKNEIKSLLQVIEQKDNHIRLLEHKIQTSEHENSTTQEVYEAQIKKLISELDKITILNNSQKKDITALKSQNQQTNQSYEQQQAQIRQEYESVIQDKQRQLTELHSSFKKYDKQIRQKDQEIRDSQSIIEQKDMILRKLETENKKLLTDLNQYKDRCKDFEQELEQIRGGGNGNGLENNSLFGNTSYINKSNASMLQRVGGQGGNNYDFEVKKIKDMFTQQLTKVKEESSKYKQQFKDAEIKLKAMEEENRKKLQVSIQQTSEKIEKDQELINDLNKTKLELKACKQMEVDIRECFNFHSKDDLTDKLLGVREELEVKFILEKEVEKLQYQLKEAQQREIKLIEMQSQMNNNMNNKQGPESQTSNFTRNLLMSKDKEIETLKSQYEREKETRVKLEDSVWKLQSELKQASASNRDLEDQILTNNNETNKIREAKDKAERNVDELKEKLRILIREQEANSNNLAKQSMRKDTQAQDRFLDQIDRGKYEDLINMILELDLATDPLAQFPNLDLQESFIDEYEQASKHLLEQKRLVQDLISHLRKDLSQLQASLSSLNDDVQNKATLLDQQKREMFKLQDQIRDRERKMEIKDIEMKQLEEQCQTIVQQRYELEQVIAKLKQENEEVNTNFRKMMRAQEHLHKGNKGAIELNKQPVGNSQQNKVEMERLMMSYEDQTSRLVSQIEKLKTMSKEQEESVMIEHRQHYREEMLDMLDKLIDSSTKMPTFNDLAMKLATRLDKVRNQERIKLSNIEDTNSLKQSENKIMNQGGNSQSEGRMIDTFKQEMDSINNEEELIQSINKWLKQSGGNLKQQQNQFKNFFNHEDQKSLMLSELIPAYSSTQQPNQQQVSPDLLNQKDQLIQELEQKIQSLEMQIQEIAKNSNTDLWKAKEQAYKEAEDNYHQKLKEIDNDQKNRNSKMWQEVEQLKESIKQELVAKTQKLDLEYEELEAQKQKLRENIIKQQQEMDQAFAKRVESYEKDFTQKLKQIESELKQGIETSKEQQFTTLYRQLEDQYNQRLKSQQEEHQSQISILKKEAAEKMEDSKKVKEREMKKVKDEVERHKKSNDDKIKKMEMEFSNEKECLEREFKDKLENQIQKGKKDAKNAQDKVRAEMRNQIDQVKNDIAKQKAEFEREKKKLIQDFESSKESLKREFEEQNEVVIKAQKQQNDKLWKKKLDQQAQENNKKIEEFEAEIIKIQETYKEEQKKERERLEVRLKDQIRGDVKLEVQQELEIEWQEERDRLRQQHAQEIDRIKTKYEIIIREERASQMPLPEANHNRQNDSKTVEVQCDFQQQHQESDDDDEVEYIHKSQSNIPIQRQSHNNNNSFQLINNSLYIEQLKHNFEEELERQKQVFEDELIARQQRSVRIFEDLLNLEFDKILQSIYHKSSNPGVNTSQQAFDLKKNEIAKLIKDIIIRNDDRKVGQMKASFDNIRIKISEVLRVFKTEVENKANKKYSQQQQQEEMQMKQMRANNNNMSDIMSLQNQNQQVNISTSEIQSTLSGNGCEDFYSQQDLSKINSQMPTPRHLNMKERNRQENSNHKQYLNLSEDKNNQLSDVKKYAQEETQHENILKKISPVPNSQGVLVVEVDKVVRDLNMLRQTIKQAQFYKIIISTDEQASQNEKLDLSSEDQLQNYRFLLNDLLRVVKKLNNGVDALTKQSEVYKLKLLYSEMRDKLLKYQNQEQQDQAQIKTEQVLQYYNINSKNYSSLSQDSQECLNILENARFDINKLQLKLYQVLGLFTVDQGMINQNQREINQKCSQYLVQMPNDQQPLMLSQNQFSPSKKAIISPELLSPEEIAQLIADVFQKLNNTQKLMNTNKYQTQMNNDQLDSYQSFFQTFLSNDEYVRSAENFINKYREQQMKNNTYSNNNMPLQVENMKYTNNGNKIQRNYSSMKLQNSKIGRSRSQQSNEHSTSVYTSIPHYLNNTQSNNFVSNVFQSNLFEKGSTHTPINRQNSNILISNYDTLSNHNYSQQQNYQQILNQQQKHHNSTSNSRTPMMFPSKQQIRNNQSVTILNHDEVTNAQSNMNVLFERLKSNLQTTTSHNASKNHSFQ